MLRLLAMVAAAAAVVWIAGSERQPPARARDDAAGAVAEGLRDASASLERAVEAVKPDAAEPRRVAPPEPLVAEAPPPEPEGAEPVAPPAPARVETAPLPQQRVDSAEPTPEGVSDARFADPLSRSEAEAVRGRLDQVMSRASRGRP